MSFRNNPDDIQNYPDNCTRQASPNNKIFSITNIFKGYKITDFTRPIKFGTTTNQIAIRNAVEFGSRNDYVLLVATRQNTLYS
jgi:hypothetical protein